MTAQRAEAGASLSFCNALFAYADFAKLHILASFFRHLGYAAPTDIKAPIGLGQNMYLHIDERTDVLASLSVCLNCVNSVKSDPHVWKWAILALHNALQGAMVCHVSGTAQLGALSDKSADASLAWHEQDRRGEIERISIGTSELGIPETRFATKEDQPPKEKLADADTLFRRLYNERKRRELGAGKVLDIEETQRNSFRRLHALRNDFSHFTPKGWSIELTGLPVIFLDTIDVIENISEDTWAFRHFDAQEHVQFEFLMNQLRTELGNISAWM